MEDKKKNAVQLLEGSDSVQLSSITLEGYPRICEMELVKSIGLSELYFTTLVASAKVEHYKFNNKAGISYSLGNDCISLVGKVEILCDMQAKKDIWINGHEGRFVLNADGTPKYCILKFKTTGATFFINGEKGNLTFDSV